MDNIDRGPSQDVYRLCKTIAGVLGAAIHNEFDWSVSLNSTSLNAPRSLTLVKHFSLDEFNYGASSFNITENSFNFGWRFITAAYRSLLIVKIYFLPLSAFCTCCPCQSSLNVSSQNLTESEEEVLIKRVLS